MRWWPVVSAGGCRISRGEVPADEGALSNSTAAIISKCPRFANYAVTRDDEGNWIGANRTAHGACGPGLIDRGGKSSISSERSGRDVQQRAPNPKLERRTPHRCSQLRARLILGRPRENLGRQFRSSLVVAIHFS